MSVPIPLRVDFDASRVRGLAKKTKDGPQARRLLALAAIYDGATRSAGAIYVMDRGYVDFRRLYAKLRGAFRPPLQRPSSFHSYCNATRIWIIPFPSLSGRRALPITVPNDFNGSLAFIA
jgi:hypothetical protein